MVKPQNDAAASAEAVIVAAIGASNDSAVTAIVIQPQYESHKLRDMMMGTQGGADRG
jgi:hypothetical protein